MICPGENCERTLPVGQDVCAYCKAAAPGLRPYKFVVQAVVQQVDAAGDIIGETVTEPVTVFGCDRLADWAHLFPEKLAQVQGGADVESRALSS